VFDLPPVARYRLARPPLVQALGQVRYPIRAAIQTLDGVALVQDRLVELFPYMNQEQLQQVSLLVGPAGPATSETQTARSWRFSDDVGWAVAVSADTATLAIGPQYGDFEEFRMRFRRVVHALEQAAGLPRCDRLGLRYVDIAELPPGQDDAWQRWFRPELTGWTASPVLAGDTRLVTSIAQTQLAAPPVGELSGPPVDIQAIVRHGYIPANTVVPGVVPAQPENPAYLLDVDLFVEAPQPFDPEELSRQITMLHDQIDRFFRWTLTSEGEEYFGLEEVG
jgi:uncharacterized protein (TIGR04255 family)